MWSFIICTVHRILLGYQVKHTGIDRTCSTLESYKQCAQYLVDIQEGRDHLSIDGMIRLNWIFKGKGSGDVDWINLAQDRELWRGATNKLMKFRVP